VKRCPICEDAYGDGEVFCTIDGGRLVASSVSPAAVSTTDLEAEARAARDLRDAPTIPPTSLCASCYRPNTDDGEGYCTACGSRLDQRMTVSILPPGAPFGEHLVLGTRASDDLLATTKLGLEVALATGEAAVLADEAAATRALAGHPAAPKLLETGEDARRGPFLVLSALPHDAILLADAAPRLTLAAAIAFAREVLAIAAALERAGLRWTARPSDFHVAGGRLLLSRARAAGLFGGLAHACCPLAAFGRSLFPTPGLAGPPALFRLLSGPGLDAPHEARGVAAMGAVLDAVEAELARPRAVSPSLAALCDRGLKRDHNEDAVAVEAGDVRGEPWAALVVCDGVSSSTHAERASAVAAKTACDTLSHFARSGDIVFEAVTGAMHAAIRAAHIAVCSTQLEFGDKEPPGTTIVAGFVYRRRLTIGWVGDSRAYWIGANGAELLTRDHSWAQELVARGEMNEVDAMDQPLAHALTRCLGPLDGGEREEHFASVQADVRSRELPGPGHLVLCTDGLWNYFPDPRAVAELVAAAGPDASCAAIAGRLVVAALHRGGGDNVSVAVHRHPATASSAEAGVAGPTPSVK
jgi:PPM family protein phosphatase